MLKGISPILSPELLQVLAAMGHGDELVIGDGNFPAASMARRLVRADGHRVPALLDAILQLFPLDSFVERPAALMAVVATPGEPAPPEPPIWAEYRRILRRHESGFTDFELVERFAFYERAREAYAVLATGEGALYANIILKKGVIPG
ncbi:MAG: L-fucose mutarotase [Spirochaetales bacterium]|nr:L-fucose mutarotase [Spirochaetales bacterium]